MAINFNNYIITPGTKVDLNDYDPDEALRMGKEAAQKKHIKLTNTLVGLEKLLYAQGKNKVLVVLQSMDAGGKDSTIKSVFGPLNPKGVKVASFKRPTEEQLSHDYLWRIHKKAPANGELRIFNRSHYEDVLVVRVHDLVPKKQWNKRYRQINDFERMLAENGTTIRKFFLNISKDEQKERMQDRLDRPDKHWKFSSADLKERDYWDDYMKAFEVALSKTSTKYAPWFVIPSNRKWTRNYIISSILIDTLKGLNMKYPAPERGMDKIVIK